MVRLLSDLTETGQDLWRFRYLLYQLIRRDIRIRYKQAVMGFGWAILMPMVVILSGLVVRVVVSQLSDVPLDTANISGLMVKAVPWSFFVGALGFATNSIAGNQVLVTKVYFPREVLPIASVAAVGFDTLIGSIAVVAVLPFLGVQLSLALLWVPVLLLLLLAFTLACSLLFSSANVFFRDVKYLVQVLVTFGIFFTPVFFEPSMLGSAGAWAMLNPIAPILEGLRLSVVEGHNLLLPLSVTGEGLDVVVWTPWYLLYCVSWAFVGLFVSVVVFSRAEVVMAEYV